MKRQTNMQLLNETHNVNLKSWVNSANSCADFPIQNLPFAIIKRKGQEEPWRGGVAIGDYVIDMAKLAKLDLFNDEAKPGAVAAAESSLNNLMGLGNKVHSALRLALSRALRDGSALESQLSSALIPQSDIEFDMPCRIGDFTDFYTSIHHATAIGKLFRPDNPLLPNYKWVPIGYHGRSSTIGISGQKFHRPKGQTKLPDAAKPTMGPSKRLDYELEMGVFIGSGTDMGDIISINDAQQHIFGVCLLNDWSARDIQAWEYQPLGPFLAKNFASAISPWIVTLEALAPYRCAFSRDSDDPQPLEYLSSANNSQYGALDIQLEVSIETEAMRNGGIGASKLSSSNFNYSYWTAAQLVTHHSSNGCAMRPGDLLGSGTQSGPTYAEAGSLLELSCGGKTPIQLSNGEKRTFLEDGDSIIMRASCQQKGAAPIGFGQVISTVLPSK
jgi:fumarylacetoacetase